MKIHFITTSYPLHPGHMAGHFVQALAERLAQRGHRLAVWAPNDGRSPEETTEGAITVHRFDYPPRKKDKQLPYGNGILPNLRARPSAVLELPAFMCALRRAGKAASKDCDLVHAHWTISGRGVPVDTPMVVSARGSDLSGAGGSLMQQISKQVIKKADAVIAENGALGEIAKPYCQNVFVLGNGVDLQKYAATRDRSTVTGTPLEGKSTMLLFVGRLSEVKGADLFLSALQQLTPGDWGAVIVGDGPLRKSFEVAGMDDRVLLTGELPTDQVVPYYQAADALVVSSRHEGRPNNVMEAQSCGLPVISFDLPGVMEMITHGKNGLIVPESSGTALMQALASFLTMTTEREAMRTTSRRWAEEHLDWEKVVDRYESIYKTVFDNPVSV